MIPCYNQQAFIQDAIESALQQSYAHREVVVVDDASTDGSADVIGRFGDAVSLVRSTVRAGSGAARNLGFAHSSGAYVLFLDGDDVLLSSTLEELQRRFEEHPDTDISYGIQRKARSEAISKPSLRSKDALCESESSLMRLYAGLDARGTIAQSVRERLQASCYLFRREALERYGLFNPALGTNEDNEIVFRHAVQGARLRFAATVTNLYRQHDAGHRMTRSAAYHVHCHDALAAMVSVVRANGLEDAEVNRQLAKEAWRYSWDAVEARDDATARSLLLIARSVSKEIYGPAWIRVLGRVFPPLALEKAFLAVWPRRRRSATSAGPSAAVPPPVAGSVASSERGA